MKLKIEPLLETPQGEQDLNRANLILQLLLIWFDMHLIEAKISNPR